MSKYNKRIKMLGLDNMSTRLNYAGGRTQEGRMKKDKARTLKRTLLYSEQSETIELEDGRIFKCLINPDKLTVDYDRKEISIPFKSLCLNRPYIEGLSVLDREEYTNLKEGNVFKWLEKKSHWLIYLRNLEEDSYFRATILRCRYQIKIGENDYHIYFKGPAVEEVQWYKGEMGHYNSLNYDAKITITQNEETLNYFKRFVELRVADRPWVVEAVDSISTVGVIDVYLKEGTNNAIKDAIIEEEANKPIPLPEEKSEARIDGLSEVYPYDILDYEVALPQGEEYNGVWTIDNDKIKILSQDNQKIQVEVRTGRSGNFTLAYVKQDWPQIFLKVKIKSL